MKRVFAAALAILLVFGGTAHAGRIVITTSDYGSGNTAVYETETGTFNPNIMGRMDQDGIVETDGEWLYFLDRSLGAVSKYDPQAVLSQGLAYQYSVGASSNPCDIVFAGEKAYVVRYLSTEVLVVDPHATTQSAYELGTIDLSAFDSSGTPEAIHGFLFGGYLYVVLQRLDNLAAVQSGHVVAIDTATDTVVDLVPSLDGVQGIDLLVKNPQYFSMVGDTAYIGGHVWGEQTEGVQALDLADPAFSQRMILSEESLMMDITGMQVFSPRQGIVYSSSWVQNSEGGWVQRGTAYWFNPETGVLGDTLPVPTPDGGAVMLGSTLYIGSRDDTSAGVYIIDAITNMPAGEPLMTTLPPLSMVYIGEEIPVAVEKEYILPEAFSVDSPSPNPFNPATTVSFTLAESRNVRAEVFNISGQQVATLINGPCPAGHNTLVWQADGAAAGVYHIRIIAGASARTVKATLVK